MTKLIGITGKAYCGKDTCAAHLWTNHAFTRIAFADPLKLAVQAAFGLTESQTWEPEEKEEVIPYWGLSPRRMFQLFGNEAMKPLFGNEHWVKRWHVAYQLLKDTDNVVVPDVRFEFEAQKIRDLGGIIIHLQRDNVPSVAAHSSEAGIAFAFGDIRVTNNATLEHLAFQLDAIVEGMELRDA